MGGKHQPMIGVPHLDPVESLANLVDRQDQVNLASQAALHLPSGLATGHGFPTLHLPQASRARARVANHQALLLPIIGVSHGVDGVHVTAHHHQESLASLVDQVLLLMTATVDGVSHRGVLQHGPNHQAPAVESQARAVDRDQESQASLVDHQAALVKTAGMDGVSHQDGEDGVLSHRAPAAVESQARAADVNKYFHHASPRYFASSSIELYLP